MPVDILGVRIDTYSKSEVLSAVRGFLHEPKSHTIFTPNPEMLVMAHKSQQLKRILNASSLNVCDGKGIQLVAKKEIKRYPGVDLMQDICRLAAKAGTSVYLLGSGNESTIEQAAENLVKQFSNLNIIGMHRGPRIKQDRIRNFEWSLNQTENSLIIEDIRKVAPEIIFVAFGHGKQEWWIHEYASRLPSVRIAMGVGGAFDFVSGKVKRAPRLLSKLGLEWLWRLIMEPWRAHRIWRATVIFLWQVSNQKFRNFVISYFS